ncbi:MAG TPA: hypothetical protein DIT32_03315 [Peptococcaceae bacterium]|nr:hypothetical protein [Peptococcaceae bacterium]
MIAAMAAISRNTKRLNKSPVRISPFNAARAIRELEVRFSAFLVTRIVRAANNTFKTSKLYKA